MFPYLRALSVIALGGIAAFFGTTVTAATAAASPSLFGGSLSVAGAANVQDRADIRARTVRPDFALIPRLAAETNDYAGLPHFNLDLFPGVEFDAEVLHAEAIAGGGTTLFVRLTGVELGNAVLVQQGDVIMGSVTLPGGAYSIRGQADGTLRIAEVAQHLLPPEHEPVTVAGAPPTAADVAVAADVPADTGRLIDVMVVYTQSAVIAAGGASAIAAEANLAVAVTNQAYMNSGIAQRVRLVYQAQVAYTETNFNNSLTALSNGSIPNVATWRDTYGADEVVMLVEDNSACGIGYLPSTISSANSGLGFAVVWRACATGNYSFAHELGHNMGAHHDPFVLGSGPCPDLKERGAFCYSRGITHIGATAVQSWRSIMAYNDECAANFPLAGGCTRIQYFSNPMVKYSDGNVMGDGPARNNALTLNKSANAVSNYRAMTQPIVASFTDVPLADPFFGYVEFMKQGGYTGGCTATTYCPNDAITRGQAAVFLERTKRGALFSRTPTGTAFVDVTVSTPFAGFIEQLAADNITSGCDATHFCPADPVVRAAMVKFILKAKCGAAYVPATPGASPFADVPLGDPFLPWINKAYTLGITSGCATGPLRFCPANYVTRAAMAKFINTAFPFGEPSEACTP